jgi:hypothetical protein
MRAWKIAAITMFVVVLTAGTAAAAGDGYKPYRGKTSQSEPFRVLLHKHGTVVRLDELFFGAMLTCEDQTTQDWGVGILWFPHGPALPDRELTVDEVDTSEAVHISGHVGPLTGRGHMTFSVPAFTADEQLQLCTTGDVTWAVHRSDVKAGTAAAGTDGTILIKIARDGIAKVEVKPAA